MFQMKLPEIFNRLFKRIRSINSNNIYQALNILKIMPKQRSNHTSSSCFPQIQLNISYIDLLVVESYRWMDFNQLAQFYSVKYESFTTCIQASHKHLILFISHMRYTAHYLSMFFLTQKQIVIQYRKIFKILIIFYYQSNYQKNRKIRIKTIFNKIYIPQQQEKRNKNKGQNNKIFLNKLLEKSIYNTNQKIRDLMLELNMKRSKQNSEVYQPFLPSKNIIIDTQLANFEHTVCLHRLYMVSLVKAIIVSVFLSVILISFQSLQIQFSNYFIVSEIFWYLFCFLIKKSYKPYPYYMLNRVLVGFMILLLMFLISSVAYVGNKKDTLADQTIYILWLIDLALYFIQTFFLLCLIGKTITLLRYKNQIRESQKFKLKPLKIVRWTYQRSKKPIKFTVNTQPAKSFVSGNVPGKVGDQSSSTKSLK